MSRPLPRRRGRPLRRRRRRRTYRWEGYVEYLDDDWFGAMLTPVDHVSPDLWAEFPRALLPEAVEGLLFTVYVHRRGRRYRHVVRARVPRPRGPALLEGWFDESCPSDPGHEGRDSPTAH